MDLSIPIIGAIAFLGYSLNDSKAPRTEEKIRKKISPHELPSGKNVYNSTFSKEIYEKERQIADIQFAKSRYPKETNIIPPLYNTECTWGCDKKISEYAVFDDSSQKILNNKTSNAPKVNAKQRIMNGPMFNSSLQGFEITTEQPYEIKEKFDNTVSQLSGLPIDLSHDNMVPFFGTNVTQNTDLSRGSAILGNYTGMGEDLKIPRAETMQMFKPSKQEIHGSKTYGDLVDTSRYIPSIYQNNVLPVPQIRVQPLPEEYVRPAYKSVDNLRVANNPKNEYQKPLTSGKNFVTGRGVQSQFSKNRPEKYYDNGSDRYLVTTGETLAPTSRENYSNNRTGIKNVIAEVGLNVNGGYNPTKSELQRYTKEQCSTGGDSVDTSNRKKETKRDWIRNVKSEQYDPLDDFINRESYFAPEQERETTTRMQLMPAKKEISGAYSTIAAPETTMKEINLFSYTGNATTEVTKPMDYTSEYNRIKDRQYIDDNEYISPSFQSTRGVVDTTQYDNIEISTARQDIVDRKGRMAGHNKGNILAEVGDVLQRDDKPRNNDFNLFSNKSSYTSDGISSNLFGTNTTAETNKISLEYDFSKRFADPALVAALKTNPLSTEFGK